MKILRFLLVTFLILAALAGAAYFGVDYWLESAGGKRALEKTLESRIGMPVSLQGDLDIRLLPPVGIQAEQLAVSDPVTGEAVATGKRLEADLALAPLLREELEIRQLEITGLKLALADGNSLFVPLIRLGTFGFNRKTDFFIDWSWLGQVEGQFAWFPGEARVDLDAEWGGSEWHEIGYRGRIDYGIPGVVRFGGAEVTVGTQSVTGEGCLLMDGLPVLNLDLAADRLDLDELLDGIPGGHDAGGSLPLGLNLELDIGELRQGETVARDARLELGATPFCP